MIQHCLHESVHAFSCLMHAFTCTACGSIAKVLHHYSIMLAGIWTTSIPVCVSATMRRTRHTLNCQSNAQHSSTSYLLLGCPHRGGQAEQSSGMVLPFDPMTMTFKDLHYFVPIPKVRTHFTDRLGCSADYMLRTLTVHACIPDFFRYQKLFYALL